MFMLFPNSYVEILTPKDDLLGGGIFGRSIGHEGGALVNGISVLTEETPQSSLTLCTQGEAGCLQAERGPHQTQPHKAKILGFLNCENKISVVYKLPSPWYFGYSHPNGLREGQRGENPNIYYFVLQLS